MYSAIMGYLIIDYCNKRLSFTSDYFGSVKTQTHYFISSTLYLQTAESSPNGKRSEGAPHARSAEKITVVRVCTARV